MRPQNAVPFVALILIFSLITLSCSAGQNSLVGVANATGETAGFWLGLWHGTISPIAWIISLFDPSVGVYEVHNNGGWYNFGFILGFGGIQLRIYSRFRGDSKAMQ